MNVLSLFDGISGAQVALKRAGIAVDKYYASEVDKYAITITQKNHPDTIQLGDVTQWGRWELPEIDLLVAGSPCQGFSFAGKQLNFDDHRSKLFFEFVDILRHHKPKHFLLENVKMKKEYQDVISDLVGVEPVEINSALLSAQNRRRLYWTNIQGIEQPEDKGILLKDIIEASAFNRPCEPRDFKEESLCHHAATDINGNESIKRVYAESGKSPTLTTMGGGHREPKILCGAMRGRYLIDGKRQDGKMLKAGKTKQYIELRHDEKTNTLTTVAKDNHIVETMSEKVRHLPEELSYRKLSPLECERLQTVLQYIKQVEIVLCSDQAKSFVLAVERNPKLLKLVSSAESKELKEYVKLANQNTNVSQASKKYTVLQDAGMTTPPQTRKCTKGSQGEKSLTVNSAENITTCKQARIEENSVIQSVFMNITEGKTTHYGKEELLPTEQSYTELMNGKIVLNLSGKETMQNASDALKVIEIMQTNQNTTSITSFRLSTKNLEQMLIISYWFAKNVTTGFTHDTIKTKTLYLNLIDGYTNHVSNTQRYKALGNSFTVDVIAHILKGIVLTP